MSRIIYNIRDMKGGGIVDNGYTKRIRERVLSLEDGTVFVMSDFADIADTSTIRQSLSRLVQSGTLRRILKGVFIMARVKNTMNVIQNTEINTYYDASVLNLQEIKRNSKGIFDLIYNSFIFGYAQGMKAAKAEIQRGGYNTWEKQ